MESFRCQVNAFGLIAIFLIPGVIIFGFILSGRFRLQFASAMSFLGILILGWFWAYDLSMTENLSLGFTEESPKVRVFRTFTFDSSGGRIAIGFKQSQDVDAGGDAWKSPEYNWYRRSTSNPELGTRWPMWKAAGFEMTWLNAPGPAKSLVHLWEIVLPNWAAMIPFVLAPSLYSYRRWMRPWRRRRQKRCVFCGYPRIGLPFNIACPECGKMPTSSRANSGATLDSAKGIATPPEEESMGTSAATPERPA